MSEVRSHTASILGRLGRMRAEEPALFWMRVLLAVAGVGLLAVVIGGDPGDGVPRRAAEGKTIRPIDYWRTQGWYVAAAEVVVVTLLLATTRWWVRLTPAPRVAALAPPPRPGRAFVACVAAAVLACAVLAWPRLEHSYWDDEEYNVEHSIDGSYFVARNGELRFREAALRDTLWWYDSPNNHVPHTILAKLVVRTWKGLVRPDHEIVPEPVARAPALVAGLLAVAAAAGLLWRMGYPGAGVLAAWILAVHPWHLKYTSEARGYTLVMLAMSVMPWLFLRVLHQGSWGRFAAFGVAQFLLLWLNTAQAFHMLLLNAALGISLLWLHRREPEQLVAQGARWLSVALLGALAWVLLMTPNLMQAAIYMEDTRGARDLGLWWWQTAGSHLVAGMSWSLGERGLDSVYPELIDVARARPLLLWSMVGAGVLAMLAGAARVVRRGGPMALLPAVMLLTPPVTWAVAWLQQANAYTWYLVFAVPTLAMLCGLGFDLLLAWARPRSPSGAAARLRVLPAAVAGGVLVAWLAAYWSVTERSREALRERSWKPARESVLLTRPSLDPRDPRNAVVLTATFCSEPLYYDPLARVLEDAEGLRRLMDEADRRGAELYVNAGRMYRAEKYWQEILDLLADEARFEVVDVLHGYEPPWTRTVWRYRGPSS